MPIFDKNKKKKEGEQIELNTINEQQEQADMEIDGLNPPSPDTYVDANNQIISNGVQQYQPAEIPLNENVLEDLIKKEEENLSKKYNSKTKSLDEIKKNLNKLDSYFNNVKKNIYEDMFYANLKEEINK